MKEPLSTETVDWKVSWKRHLLVVEREVVIYDITKPFLITGDFDIKMQNKSLADALELIVIKDNEIAIQLKNGLYFTTLGAGRYAYWKDSNPYTYEMVNLDELRVGNNINKSWFGKAELLGYLRSAQ